MPATDVVSFAFAVMTFPFARQPPFVTLAYLQPRQQIIFHNRLACLCFTIARHAFSHLRHSSAHAFMCSSFGNFSQAVPHWSQAFAQQSQIRTDCGPPLETICAAVAQIVAQS